MNMRPMPPDTLLGEFEPMFTPAPELMSWALANFIEPDAPLHNADHHHLNSATIGALWTNVENGRGGRRIVGQCECGIPGMGKWIKARAERQLIDWFGAPPDFVLTFDAHYCAQCSDAQFMALVEHELYHAGQARDDFGQPRFSKMTGLPIFALRGHDVEEFVGVVRRYGSDAAGVRALVDAANRRPEIATASIAEACGNCLARAA